MLAILIILFVIILIEIIIISFTFSNIVINIEKCDFSYNEIVLKEFNVKNINIVINIYIFKIVKILSIKVYKDYFEIFKIKIKYNLLRKVKNNYNTLYNDFFAIIKNRENINFKLLKPKINSLDFNLDFGTYSQILTTFSIPAISTFVSLLLSNSITNYDINTYNYKIVPRYFNRNYLKIELSSKFSFNTINLILFLLSIRKILKENKKQKNKVY